MSAAKEGNKQDATLLSSSIKPFQELSNPCEETPNPQISSAKQPMRENGLVSLAETRVCDEKDIPFQPPTDDGCSSDSTANSLGLQQQYVIPASNVVESNYIESSRDQIGAEEVEISDNNATPSSPIVSGGNGTSSIYRSFVRAGTECKGGNRMKLWHARFDELQL